MENSSTSKLRRPSLIPARFKGQHIDIFKRGNNHLAEARAQDGRRHEFSLDSLDKEILQTMSRGNKNTQINPPNELAIESLGSTQEKVMCSRELAHPEPAPYIMPNGVHSSESTSKTSKKPSEQRHGTSNAGQYQAPPLPTWPEADASSDGYTKQVSVNVNGGNHQQDPGHWHHSGGTLHPHCPRGNNEMQVYQLKDSSCQDVHPLNGRLDEGSSSDTSEEHTGEEAKKQASEGPYSGSISMFAYPVTPQRLFSGGQRNDAQCANVGDVTMGSPDTYESATKTHSGAQYSGGRSQQRSATKSNFTKAPPSKWSDAGKWIASPGHTDSAITQTTRSNQALVPSPLTLPGMRSAVARQLALDESNERDCPNLAASIVDQSFSLNDNGNTSSVTKKSTSSSSGNTSSANESTSSVRVKNHVKQLESAIQNSQTKSPSSSDVAKRRDPPRPSSKCAGDTRDTSVISSTMFVQRPKDGFISQPKLLVEPQAAQNPVSTFLTEKSPSAVTPTDAPVKDIFSNGSHSRTVSGFPSSISVGEPGADTAQKTSSIYRDMGTQMTPNPSGRLSRGAIPRTSDFSPGRENTPDHSRGNAPLGAPANEEMIHFQDFHMQKHGRSSPPQPILDRNTNWSIREEEEEECATRLRTQDYGEKQTSANVIWAAAWEEAECAKYTARFHQEEARIQAWEELQKAKAETQMRKTEVKLEKMHNSASQKMSNKIAAAGRKAENMRAAAEACRDELATKAKHRAEYIRQAWEELQKAKAETQMRKTEVKLEKMHDSVSQKMSNKIAAAGRKAENMRAAAEACRDELATKAKHRAEYIRQAWEELQKAKAETQMRKTEVKLEKMHDSASQKMSNKIAAAGRKAENMRAAAEACRDELATKAKHRAEYIRQAWEELQKAKAETQMRKTEVKLEKMHDSASQKMSNKIAAAGRKAENMRAAAEACRDELAAKAKHRAEYIRQTGSVPTTLGCLANRFVPYQSNSQ